MDMLCFLVLLILIFLHIRIYIILQLFWIHTMQLFYNLDILYIKTRQCIDIDLPERLWCLFPSLFPKVPTGQHKMLLAIHIIKQIKIKIIL